MNKNSKPLVFLSYTDDGIKEANEIKKCLEEKLNVIIWEWRNEILVGAPIVSTYSDAVAKSDFMVAVLSPMYWEKKGTIREQAIAAQREVDLKVVYGDDYNFVLPYCGSWALPTSSDKRFKMAAHTIDALVKSIQHQLPPAMLSKCKHSFSTWPSPFVDKNGNVDCVIVIGHNDKQDDLKEDDLGILNKYIDLNKRAGHQSHRPAEFISNLTRYFYQKSIVKKHSLEFDIKSIELDLIECHIDVLLIKYRMELLKNHNILTLGAGDTNYVSRWILEYYKDTLPIYYRNTSASEDISIRLEKEGKDRLIRDSFSGKNKYSGIIAILPNPFNPDKAVVVAAGLNALATQASILALCDLHEKIKEGNIEENNITYLILGQEENWRAIGYKLYNPTENF